MPRVTVVIPAYNASSFLCTTLRYALLSEFRDLEVVVVDDGSADDTAALADGFDSRVRVIQQANAGMSAARNKAITDSDSEFIALLDADDIWSPRKLGAQIQVLVDRPAFGLVFTEFRSWDGCAPIAWPERGDDPPEKLVDALTGWIYHQLVNTNWALPSSWLMRRSAVDHVGLFLTEDHLTDDWEYIIRFSRHFEIAKLAEVMVLYRKSPNQLSKTFAPRNHDVEMREKMIAKYGYTSPDGTEVDQQTLRATRFRGHYNFGLRHIGKGDIGVGFHELGKAFNYGKKASAPIDISKHLARRVVSFGKSFKK